MWDAFAEYRVDVRSDPVCGSYIMIPPDKINAVQSLLDSHGIPYRLEDDAHACKGTPEAAVIEFGKGADMQKIQHVLDSVS